MRSIRPDDPVLDKGFKLLSHPLTILSLIILFVNDWFLRLYTPSWLTGKIGDFAWLFFFPIGLAAVLSILIPAHLLKKEDIVKFSAFIITGLIFTLPKTIPPINQALNQFLESMLKLSINIRRDPSDLLALFSLGLAWKFWDLDDSRLPSSANLGWLSLQFALLLTLANAPAPDYGIDTLEIVDGQVFAYSSYYRFLSEDGGMTWETLEYDYPADDSGGRSESGLIRYEFILGEYIKISKDGGKTFPFAYSLVPTNQPLQLKYEQRKGSPIYRPGPLDTVVDPRSGNIIFAMGHEGILVFSTNNTWEWVSIKNYQRLTYEPKEEFFSFLLGEFLLSMSFGFLVINTITIGIHKGWIRKGLVAFGWLILVLNVTLFPPAIYLNQLQPDFGILALVFYLLQLLGIALFCVLAIFDLIKVFKSSNRLGLLIITIGLIGVAVFFTPYVLWGFNFLAKYSTAALIAAVAGAALFISVSFLMLHPMADFTNANQAS